MQGIIGGYNGEPVGLTRCFAVGDTAFYDTRIGYGLVGKSEELANIGYIGADAFGHAHLGGDDDTVSDVDRGLWVDRNCVHIGAYAFGHNPNLRWIGLPGPSHDISDISEMDQIRRLSLESSQFYGCSGLSNIINLEFQTSFSTNAIVGCNSLPFLNLFYVDTVSVDNSTDMAGIPVSYIHIGPALASQLSTMVSMFQGCSMLNKVTIATSTGPDGYKFSIPDYCFSGLSTLTSVEGLYSCSGIGSYAFVGTNIEFSNPDQLMYVQSIGEYALNGCPYVDVNYLWNCRHIGTCAFENNSNISELIFGPSMEYIGDGAFDLCTNLYGVYFHNDESSMPNITMGSYAFAACGNLTNVCLTNTS